MLVSLEHDFVFLCNRKCASVSIEHMLRRHADVQVAGPPGIRHTNYRTYCKYFAPWLRETAGRPQPETICVVREPVSWLYSWYRFRSRLALRDPGNADHRKSTAGVSFEEFVRAYLGPRPPAFADVGCQFDFVRDDSGEIGVDRMFAYDGLDELVRFMSAKIGETLRLAHKNVSPKKNRTLYLASVVDRLVKSATSQSGLSRGAAKPETPALPDDLNAELMRSIAEDFALYERVRRSPGAHFAGGARHTELRTGS